VLEQHVAIFTEIARKKQCHIIVRCPNRASDQFMGRAFFTAKPLECKAKTANNLAHQFAGLVVSPEKLREAFLSNSYRGAKEAWEKFTANGMPSGYSLAAGQWSGCLTLNGNLIHADYDLLAVTPAEGPVDDQNNPRLRAYSTEEYGMISALTKEIMDALNYEFKCPLVKHGAEFDVDLYHFGSCIHFRPDGSHESVTYTGNQTRPGPRTMNA